jgi:hypothetical protein
MVLSNIGARDQTKQNGVLKNVSCFAAAQIEFPLGQVSRSQAGYLDDRHQRDCDFACTLTIFAPRQETNNHDSRNRLAEQIV